MLMPSTSAMLFMVVGSALVLPVSILDIVVECTPALRASSSWVHPLTVRVLISLGMSYLMTCIVSMTRLCV